MRFINHRSFRQCFRASLTLAAALAFAVATPSVWGQGQSVEAVMENVHNNFEKMGDAVGELSAEQKAKLADVEKKIAEKVKADPASAEGPAFRTEVIQQFRGVLTPEQQAKFDKLVAESNRARAGILTASRLHLIGILGMTYANGHGTLPPNLGDLLSPETRPDTFLIGGSKTQIPGDFAALDAKKQAEWVNDHTDFVYLGSGKAFAGLSGDFVLAYEKTGGAEQRFLFGDGRVLSFHAEQAAKIIADVKSGKNPPPSLPLQP